MNLLKIPKLEKADLESLVEKLRKQGIDAVLYECSKKIDILPKEKVMI